MGRKNTRNECGGDREDIDCNHSVALPHSHRAVGGIAGGGTGAGIGALVGGVGGTVMAATGQPHVKIPVETRLQFQLAADWKVQ